MENKALYDFINETCKNDDTDLDVAIASLQSAIGTLQKEVEKREYQKRQHLIDDFVKAYQALVNADIRVRYDFDTEYAYNEASDNDSYCCSSTVLEMDNVNNFVFD
jgi:hypothetical protein